ncbi:MAG: TIGR03767 family metallophosphoesterase [Acidimicrobiales bacterium]|jgi:metallophosphoesterase (TIGR03767 family)|nr:TIGR03767 family metallophosphoesterase [Acidimicrobiales bacterium]
MSLSRRQFILRVSAAAGATLPVWALAAACTGDDAGGPDTTSPDGTSVVRGERATTLDATIALVAGSGYRALQWGPGEPFLPRDDLGVAPGPDRVAARRSILYFGQLSDTHVVDTQTPSRADWTFALNQDQNAFRAQETLTVHVLAEMVAAVNALQRSVVTGAPAAVTVITGDLADSHATVEMNWYLDTLAGRNVIPNSGAKGTYEGVQVWDESAWAYHPEDPSKDLWGENGYPAIPGLLSAAVSNEVRSEGLRTPWLSVLGNHDTVWMGTLGPYTAPFDQLATGTSKIANPPPDTAQLYSDVSNPANAADQTDFAQLVTTLGTQAGVRQVTPAADRRGFTRQEIIDAHFAIDDPVGPRGHGFTEASRTTGDAWWSRSIGPAVKFIALDTNNQWFGADGSIRQPQWEWLEAELQNASSTYLDANGEVVTNSATDQIVVVLSHHTSWTMENVAAEPGDTTQLYTGADLVALLLRFPNVVAWCNGHTHANTIVPHPTTSTTLGGGFWEINTPSCIDWGQQSRMVELVDNRDGTLSIFTLTVDHAAPPDVRPGDLSQTNLASTSRQLAANPWFWDAAALLGTPTDRNTELLVKAPFDLSRISDATLEDHSLRVSLREKMGISPR